MRSGGEFVIVLDARMSLDASILVLLHEWAHCIAWTTGDFTRDHGPEWGIAYARCYCAALGVEWHDNQPGGDRGEG